MAQKVTQADVARLSGVSQATVSLVLNGDAARMGAATRQRVLDAIDRTGYFANPVAQRLAKGRNHIVGVYTYEPVFPRGGGDFYHPFLVGIEAGAERSGNDLLLFTSAQGQERRGGLSGKARARLGITDGCVLLGRHEDKNQLVHLIDDGFPFVFVGRRELPGAAEIPYVGADYVTATQDTVELFLRAGHERIGFIGELSDRESSADRVTGYRGAMRGAGLRPTLFDAGDLTPAEILDVVVDNQLTGVVLAEGHRADGIAAAAAARGMEVPADLSIAVLGQPEVPVEDTHVWSGFRIPREQMGEQAFGLLIDIIERPDQADRHRLLSCAIEAGETVVPPRATTGAGDT